MEVAAVAAAVVTSGQALRAAGDLAKRLGHRLTFHPSEYCKIAGERPE